MPWCPKPCCRFDSIVIYYSIAAKTHKPITLTFVFCLWLVNRTLLNAFIILRVSTSLQIKKPFIKALNLRAYHTPEHTCQVERFSPFQGHQARNCTCAEEGFLSHGLKTPWSRTRLYQGVLLKESRILIPYCSTELLSDYGGNQL